MGAFQNTIAKGVKDEVFDYLFRAAQNLYGDVYWVFEDSDTNYQAMIKTHPKNVFNTVLGAYNATTTNNNDVIFISAHTGHALTAMLTVSKNKVHFIGMGGDGRIGDQRTRVTIGVTTAVTDVALIRVTGQGCTFRNIKFATSNTLTEAVTCFQDESPNGLLVKNCSIHSIGSAQLTATGGSALRLAGDGSLYDRCQIGADTILNTVANQVVHIKTIDSAVAKRVVFKECLFYTYSSDSTHVFVKVPTASGDVDRYVFFKDCDFLNFATADGGGTTLAVAFESEITAGGHIFVSGGSAFGVTDFASA